MPLQAQQICTLALQISNTPGWTSQAGQLLNAILQDLAQDYDFSQNLKTINFTFDTSTVYQNNNPGAGPNILPADYLRAKNRENIYYILGVRYVLIIVDQWEFDALVQTAGWTSYPQFGYADLALQTPFDGQKGLMVWPPASGAYPIQIRYHAQPLDIVNPATSAVVPWFPNQNYLITRLAGELMKIADDERAQNFLGSDDEGKDAPGSAAQILRRFMKMKDDPEGRVRRVDLDRRFFGSSFRSLPNTKIIGW
jgi:hypothetical protein